MIFNDEYFMRMALKEAELAYQQGEVPVGAVVVSGGIPIAKGHNLTETLNDVTAHAEIQAITAAAGSLGGKYLNDCVLYVTLEPCLMCAGAMYWAQLGGLIFGAYDEKRGYKSVKPSVLHPRTSVRGGVLEAEASQLLKDFFKSKRI